MVDTKVSNVHIETASVNAKAFMFVLAMLSVMLYSLNAKDLVRSSLHLSLD